MKKYIDDLLAISQNDLLEGLLGHGLFNSKMPSIFTSEPFYNYCISKNPSFSKKWADWVRFDNNRNNGMPRTLGIPSPFLYYHLAKCLSTNWKALLSYFNLETGSQSFKVSRTHIRKLYGTKAIFEMNYDKYNVDGPSTPTNAIKARFVVKTDISQFFNSIYTHSLPWAIIGKPASKRKHPSDYSDEIDKCTAAIKYGETHGILIGPTSSNLVSEIILCKIDHALLDGGFVFVRHIDDYKCFVENIAQGEAFLNKLRLELALFDLSINEKKTEIVPIDTYHSNDLGERIRQLDYLLSPSKKYSVITYPQLSSYLDAIFRLYEELNCNCSVYSFAFKHLSNYALSNNASRLLIDKSMNLSIIHPYLLPFLQKWIFEKYGISDNMFEFCLTLYDNGINESNYEKCIYALYFALINDIDFYSKQKQDLVKNASERSDCLLKLLSRMYCLEFYPGEFDSYFYKMALSIKSVSKDDFDRNWIFAYEVLNADNLDGDWKIIKSANVSFLDKLKFRKMHHWKTVFYT